ncbi:hypothetical protein GIB67_000420 [Kingdonia uniflora]|uniref:DUF4283 domain-containing protein n=1 Tax=Kingdonia uniflora TaxID=39325 RepID=A0A7J7MQ08_9MAGN|nr:hypothetical protein GIB67_000420 [Kingdonia uniflora]
MEGKTQVTGDVRRSNRVRAPSAKKITSRVDEDYILALEALVQVNALPEIRMMIKATQENTRSQDVASVEAFDEELGPQELDENRGYNNLGIQECHSKERTKCTPVSDPTVNSKSKGVQGNINEADRTGKEGENTTTGGCANKCTTGNNLIANTEQPWMWEAGQLISEYIPSAVINGTPSAIFKSADYEDDFNDSAAMPVGYFIGRRHAFNYVEYLIKTWELEGDFKMTLQRNNIFFYKFYSEEDREKALEAGPQSIAIRILIPRTWRPFIKYENRDESTVPIWIILKDIPRQFRNHSGIAHIASIIGKPICFDKAA